MHDANRLKQLLPQAAGNKIFGDATAINDNRNRNKLRAALSCLK